MSDDVTVRPFRIDVADAVLDDLHRRLNLTRWPEAEAVDDWSQGVPLEWMQDMCRYWRQGYDWRAQESRLNRFD
ncbi:MAG TPA: epoxide hydrolase N-terminal domain-containing protein, partial [Ilumatobacteraceae bacterium]